MPTPVHHETHKRLARSAKMTRRFPPPWIVEPIPGGFKVRDATGHALAYVYSRPIAVNAGVANVLTSEEARRIAEDIAKLPELLRKLESPPSAESEPPFAV